MEGPPHRNAGSGVLESSAEISMSKI
jgi:hypothetical protein